MEEILYHIGNHIGTKRQIRNEVKNGETLRKQKSRGL